MSVLFSKSHEWVKIDNNIAMVGISHFAQSELGDITYIDLPSVGTKVQVGKEFASVESVKAASDVYSPVDGEIVEVNDMLNNSPEIVNSDPQDKGWFIKVKLSANPEGLLSKEEYERTCTQH